MRKYFYLKDGDQKGPVSFEELKQVDFSEDTLIWFEGLEKWVSASEVPELKQKFVVISPPPFNREKELGVTSDSAYGIKETPKKKLVNIFSLNGEIGRREYGFTIIILTLIFILMSQVTVRMISNQELSGYVSLLVTLLLSYITFSQGYKRCKNMGINGWFSVLQFIPFGWFIAEILPSLDYLVVRLAPLFVLVLVFYPSKR